MLSGRGVRALDRQIEAHKRFTRSGYTGHEADGLAVVSFAVINNAVDFVCGNSQVLGAGIAAGNIMDVVASVKRLRCLNDRRCGEIFGILPLYVVKCRLSIAACNCFDGHADVR